MDTSNQLSVLSLNCWGLYLISKQRRHRLQAIGEAIGQANYDVVTLQEVWVQEDFNQLKARVAAKLPYAKYFYSGALGSGLAILSKYPITFTSYFRYTLAGRPLKVFHGDYYVGKGCASVCLEHPLAGTIQVFTTHLHAGYGKADEYQGHRITETWELANLLRSAAAQGREIIMTGDLNSIPTSHNYRILTEHAFMTDSWLETHHADEHHDGLEQSPGNKDADYFIQKFGITCNSSSNTWSKHFQIEHQQSMLQSTVGSRLDYIFYRRTPQLRCTDSCVVMTGLIPGTTMSYSDHFGVQSTFIIGNGADSSLPQTPSNAISPPVTTLAQLTFTNLDLTTVQELVSILQNDLTSIHQTSRRLLRGFVCFVILIFATYLIIVIVPYQVIVSSSPAPPLRQGKDLTIVWLLPLLLGISLLVFSILAMICLIVGFVFGYGERNAMRQFIIDIQSLLHGIQLRNRNATFD